MNLINVYSRGMLNCNLHPGLALKNSFILLLLLTCSTLTFSQQHCDGTRYVNPIFSSIDSTLNIKFGENFTIAGSQRELFMDIYTPPAEFFFARPLIILAHGGSFLSGNRKQVRQLCLEYAGRGYVAATIDYRLFDAFALEIDSNLAFDAAIKATMDMKAAIRWFKENAAGANDYGIDTNIVFIGGVSAGAIAADHCAYLDADDDGGITLDSIINANGGIRGNSSSNFQFSEKVAGVLNFSGALKNVAWISSDEPPLFSMHDQFDGIVPYGTAITTEFGTPIQISGSRAMHQEAVNKVMRSQLITIGGSSGHVSYFIGGPNTANYNLAIDSSSLFLEYIICDRISATQNLEQNQESIGWWPNPTHGALYSREVATAHVFDLEGRMVFAYNNASERMNLDFLNAGIYIIESVNNDGVHTVQKIVLQ